METAAFWPAPRPFPVTDEGTAERSFELNWRATQLLRVDEHDRALMAPKLIAKARAMTTHSRPEAIFEATAVAAQIGWIEISLPAAAAQAIRAVEDLLSAGHTESSMAIYHQLKVFEACEYDLLATWETPDALICVPGFILSNRS
jgi:hypothetical protein